jgi:hypothetical protein
MAVADPLNVAMRMANKLADDLPRNLDIAILRHTIHQLAAAARPAAKPAPKRRHRVVAPGYWALRKRIQRARAKADAAARAAGQSV